MKNDTIIDRDFNNSSELLKKSKDIFLYHRAST